MATKLPWPATPEDVANLPRNHVHDLIQMIVDRLDLEDGDPDSEDEERQDKIDLTGRILPGVQGPYDSEDAENSFTEWHTRGRHKLFAGEFVAPRTYTSAVIEDAEDDDPDQCLAADDDPARLFSDGSPGDPEDAEDGYDREQVNEDGYDAVLPLLPTYGVDQSRGPINEQAACRAHIERERPR